MPVLPNSTLANQFPLHYSSITPSPTFPASTEELTFLSPANAAALHLEPTLELRLPSMTLALEILSFRFITPFLARVLLGFRKLASLLDYRRQKPMPIRASRHERRESRAKPT